MVFQNISHNIFNFISCKYFLFCFLIYCIVFYNFYIMYSNKFLKNVLCCFFWNISQCFSIFLRITVTVACFPDWVSSSAWEQLVCGASWQHYWPCQLWPVPRLAHRAQLLHVVQGSVAVAAEDASFPSQYYLTSALVHLYSLRAVRAKTWGTVLCWHF